MPLLSIDTFFVDFKILRHYNSLSIGILQSLLKSRIISYIQIPFLMAEILTTREIAKYLKLHEITVCKYAANGNIPAIRIGKVWRFDKAAIDKWISGDQEKNPADTLKE